MWREPRRIVAAVGLLALPALALGGCSSCLGIDKITDTITDTTTKTTGVLQDGIDKISGNLSSWQTVLQEMQSKLTEDAQSTVRNELTTLLQGSIAVANSSIMCTVDFIGHRVVQALQRLLARVKGESPGDILTPTACSAVPGGIEFKAWQNGNIPKVDIFGYDFDADGLSLWLTSGAARSDITPRLSRVSRYQVNAPLGGTPALFNGTQQKVVLVWKGDFAHPVSEVAVLLPVTPVCDARKRTIPPIPAISYNPPLVKGDREFNGNGPDVWTQVSLLLQPGGGGIDASIYMRARETRSDWTEARGTLRRTVYTSPPGWRVDRLLTPAASSMDKYRDDNNTIDKRNPGGPVSRLEVVGDTSGDDVGETGLTAYFTNVDIWEVQTGDCVPPAVARDLVDRGVLDPALRGRLAPLLERLPADAFRPHR